MGIIISNQIRLGVFAPDFSPTGSGS